MTIFFGLFTGTKTGAKNIKIDNCLKIWVFDNQCIRKMGFYFLDP
jgi:hypothetical protein